MVIVLLGPPGAGKGTQAKKMVEKFGLKHISTGDIFRKNISEKTPLGIKADEYIKKGLLVPDDLTISLVEDTLGTEETRRGFLLDGFPRTVAQADAFFGLLKSKGLELDHVINIDVPEDELVKRLSGRRVCSKCGASFHVIFNPPKNEMVCDYCKSTLVQRADDSEGAVINRLDTYKAQTQPLIDYYRKNNLLRVIEGNKEVDDVFRNICNVLGAEKE